jgi:hypothetical protein
VNNVSGVQYIYIREIHTGREDFEFFLTLGDMVMDDKKCMGY